MELGLSMRPPPPTAAKPENQVGDMVIWTLLAGIFSQPGHKHIGAFDVIGRKVYKGLLAHPSSPGI
jgi:hypothetical protein